MLEYTLAPTPVKNRQRLNLQLNPQLGINNTMFIPPSITDEQYVIPDRTIGLAISSVEVLDAIANGSIAVLGNGRLAVL